MKALKKQTLTVIMIVCGLLMTAMSVQAATTDSLFSEIDSSGLVIDGNKTLIPTDKELIRPTYLGKNLLKDMIGPENKPFKGFYGEVGTGEIAHANGQGYRNNTTTIIRNVGFHGTRKIALKMTHFTPDYGTPKKLSPTRDGGIAIVPNQYGTEFQIVYDNSIDGEAMDKKDFTEVVKNVNVELPILSTTNEQNSNNGLYSWLATKRSNLIRHVYYNPTKFKIVPRVTRTQQSFRNKDNYDVNTDVVKVEYMYTAENLIDVANTLIFDNNEPLLMGEFASTAFARNEVLFKSDLKTPMEILYMTPKTAGSKNTDKFEVNYDITQGLNDGFYRYFPQVMGVIMDDTEQMFNSISLPKLKFTDKNGGSIQATARKLSDHKYEFTLTKDQLSYLGSNQFNISITGDNLNETNVLKTYNSSKKLYEVPMTFYNYKIFNNKRKESNKMVAYAQITPNIYGEARQGVEVDIGTKSTQLRPDDLVQNVASTIVGEPLTKKVLGPEQVFSVPNKSYKVTVRLQTASKTKDIDVTVKTKNGILVKKSDFSNQPWIINEINRQLNKVIEGNPPVYDHDLDKITSISNPALGASFAGQYIPAGISKLTKLKTLVLTNKQLGGSLPATMGDLSELTELSLSGNKFTGGIQPTIGNLSKLTKLNLANSTLGGTIPTNLKKLNSLVSMDLSNNTLGGKIPPEIPKLPNIKSLNFSDNRLIGIVPEPTGTPTTYDVSNNQVTVNDNKAPTWLTGYGKTFIKSPSQLRLTGVETISVPKDNTTIYPFDNSTLYSFNLRALSIGTGGNVTLFPGHTFTIAKNFVNVVYNDKEADSTFGFSASPGETYVVNLDGAKLNDNNNFRVSNILREVKLHSYPKTLNLNLAVGNLAKKAVSVPATESLSIYDNRENAKWELKVKASPLTENTGARQLSGSFYYSNKLVSEDSFTTVDSSTNHVKSGDIVDITDSWKNGTGLMYKQNKASNYKGAYTGKVTWQLLDAPSGT